MESSVIEGICDLSFRISFIFSPFSQLHLHFMTSLGQSHPLNHLQDVAGRRQVVRGDPSITPPLEPKVINFTLHLLAEERSLSPFTFIVETQRRPQLASVSR